MKVETGVELDRHAGTEAKSVAKAEFVRGYTAAARRFAGMTLVQRYAERDRQHARSPFAKGWRAYFETHG